jgi:hypothetical protein
MLEEVILCIGFAGMCIVSVKSRRNFSRWCKREKKKQKPESKLLAINVSVTQQTCVLQFWLTQ